MTSPTPPVNSPSAYVAMVRHGERFVEAPESNLFELERDYPATIEAYVRQHCTATRALVEAGGKLYTATVYVATTGDDLAYVPVDEGRVPLDLDVQPSTMESGDAQKIDDSLHIHERERWEKDIASALLRIVEKAANVDAEMEQSLFELIVEGATELSHADCAGLWMVHPPTRELHLAAFTSVRQSDQLRFRSRIEGGQGGNTLLQRESYYCGDTNTDPQWSRFVLGIRSCYEMPMIHLDHVLGVLCVGSPRPNIFDPHLRSALDRFAKHCSALIWQRITAIEARVQKEHRIFLIASEDLDDLYRRAVEAARLLVSAESSSLFIVPPGPQSQLQLVATTGLAPGYDQDTTYYWREGITGWVASKRVPLRIKNCGDEDELRGWGSDIQWKGKTREVASRQGFERALLVVPLLDEAANCVGVLRTSGKHGGGVFLEEDKMAMEHFARALVSERGRRRPLTALRSLSEAIAGFSESPQDTLRSILKQSMKVCEADAGTIALLDGERLVDHGHIGNLVIPAEEITRSFHDQPSVTALCARTGVAQVVPDVEHPDWSPIYKQCFEGIKSELVFPLLHCGQVLGVINLESTKKDFFTQEHQVKLRICADFAASYVAYQRVDVQLKELKRWFGSYADILMKDPDRGKPKKVAQAVSVLFADIRGSTYMSELLSPDQSLVVMTEYMLEMTRVVHLYKGVIANVMGDGILALFGLYDDQQESGQALQRALTAATEMRRCFQRLRAKWYNEWATHESTRERPMLPRIGIGIGIHSGMRVYFGRFGDEHHWQITAFGADVNLAARLGDEAKHGEIFVSKAVHKSLPSASDAATMNTTQPMFWREQLRLIGEVDVGKDAFVVTYVVQ